MFRAGYKPLLEPLTTHFYSCSSILWGTSFSDSSKTEVLTELVKYIGQFRVLQRCETDSLVTAL